MDSKASHPIHSFLDTFNRINRDSLELLNQIYAENIMFQDPLHKVVGRDALYKYFERLYANVISCRFDWHYTATNGAVAFVDWTMHLRHTAIRKGNEIEVVGSSRILFDGLAINHRDYFDAGSLLYEHIPVIGNLVRLIKNKV